MNARIAQHGQRIGQRAFVAARQGTQVGESLVEQRECTTFIAGTAVGGKLGLAQGFFCVGERMLLLLQRRQLALRQAELIQLFHLVTQQLPFGLYLTAFFAELLQLATRVAPLAKRFGQLSGGIV